MQSKVVKVRLSEAKEEKRLRLTLFACWNILGVLQAVAFVVTKLVVDGQVLWLCLQSVAIFLMFVASLDCLC